MWSNGRVSGWNLPGKERRKLRLSDGKLGCSLDSGIVLYREDWEGDVKRGARKL